MTRILQLANPPKVDPKLMDSIARIYGVKGFGAERKRSANADLASRLAAATILNPEEISGEYDIARALQTTLGGRKRTLTNEDLIAFKKNIDLLQQRFKMKTRITMQQVVNMSNDPDIRRAQEQIKTAVISEYGKKGELLVTTNASQNSDVRRHHVKVIFTQFEEALSITGSLDNIVKTLLVNGGVKYDCDCKHHRYRFRYITTISGCNAGRVETGFPKITNPNLTGIACKHVITVFTRLQSPAMRESLKSWLKRARSTQDSEILRQSAQAMRAEAERQLKTAHHKRNLPTRREEKLIMQAIKKAAPKLNGTYEDRITELDGLLKDKIISRQAYNTGIQKAKKLYGVN